MIETDYPERASLEGFVGEIFQAVARGATYEQWAEWLRVPLEHAAADGNLDLFNALIGAGADGSAGWRGCYDRTLLHAAARGGNAEVVSGLLAAGAGPDVNVVLPSEERSALYLATSLGHEDAARRLVEAGANVNFNRARGNFNFRDPDDMCCDILFQAIVNGCAALVNDVLIAGADPNKFAANESAPLQTAAACGLEGIVATLLARGADADALDGDGPSPLMKAAGNGHLAVVNTLLAAGADVELRDCHDYTALTWAANHGRIDVLRAILGYGADVNAVSQHPGWTALQVAAEAGQAGAIEVLIEAGASIELEASDGRTPLCFAAFNQRREALQALLHHGANAHARDNEGNTPLHFACLSQHAAVGTTVDLLLRAGADEKALNNDGRTPAQILELLPRRGRGFPDESPRIFLEEIGRARLLLDRAPHDRAWRRRCWLVMLRSRASRARAAGCDNRDVSGHGSNAADGRGEARRSKMARSEKTGGGKSAVVGQAANGCAISFGREDGVTGAVVASLIGLELEDVFRTVLGFL